MDAIVEITLTEDKKVSVYRHIVTNLQFEWITFGWP